MKILIITSSLIVVFLLAVLALPEQSLAVSSITVRKISTPPGLGPFDFSFDAPGTMLDENFALNSGMTRTFSNLTPDTYIVTENIPEGYDLSFNFNNDCGAMINANTMSGTFTIDLPDMCDIDVFFINTGNSMVQVFKDTIPTSTTELFNFISNMPAANNFTIISSAGAIFPSIPGGTYTIQEEITPGYTLTNISCDDPDSSINLATRTATINVSENENISCTFTNTANGGIIIQKNTVPVGGTGFNFTENISEPNDSFVLNDGESEMFLDVPPGQYVVTEDDPTINPGGYFLSDIVCDDMGSSTNLVTRRATIDLDSEETITCIFTNTAQLEGLTITKTDTPDPVVVGTELRYEIEIINDSNVVATDVMLVDTLPQGLIGVEIFPNIPGVDCEFDNPMNPEMVTCDIPNLPPTQELGIAIVVIPDPDVFTQPTMIENTATLTAQPGNDMRVATIQTLVNPMVDFGIDSGNQNRNVNREGTLQIDYDISVNPDNQEILAALGSEDVQIRADAQDVMFDIDFPDAFNIDRVTTSQGGCIIGTLSVIECDLGDIQEGQTVRVTVVFIAPNENGDFTIEAIVSSFGQSLSNFVFVFVSGDGDGNCSIAAAGSIGTSNLLYLSIPLFIFTRRYWRKMKTKA